MSKGKWMALAVLQGALILSLAVHYHVLEQRDELLTDHHQLCGKYVELAQKTVFLESNLRRGYADLLERTTHRLGIGKRCHRALFVDFDRMVVKSLGIGGPADGSTE